MNTLDTQVPGFYRHKVGTITLTALNDGLLAEGAGVLSGIEAAAAATILQAAFLPPTPVITVNAFLLQTGGGHVLIDAGCGSGMGSGAGRLLANLGHAGVAPDDIGLILLTHMHPDHIGGLLDAAGGAVFPNARLLVPDADAAVFLDAALAERVPDEAKPVFAKARAVEAAYAGRLERFHGDAELAPGVRPVSLPGHSPGHTGYRITDGEQSLLVWGDVVHVPGIQFTHPKVGVVFDADPALAERTRHDAFAAAAAGRELVAGMHIAFPGLVSMAADGAGYRQFPILWNPSVGHEDPAA